MDKSEYKPEELVAKYEPSRKKIGRFCKVGLIVGIPFVALGFISCFVGLPITKNPVFLILAGVLVVIGVIFLSISFGMMSKFNKSIYAEIQKAILDTYFPERKEMPKKGFDAREIIDLGFFDPHYNHYEGKNFMSSSINGIPFRKADYKFTKSGSQDQGDTTTGHGTIYFFDFEREFAADLKIASKGCYPYSIKSKNLKEVETEFMKFNNKFRILTTDEKLVFYILTPQLQEKLIELSAHFEGGLYLDFVNSDLYFLIDDHNLTRDLSLFKPLTVERIDKVALTIAAPKIIVDVLGLATNKFKSNAGIK